MEYKTITVRWMKATSGETKRSTIFTYVIYIHAIVLNFSFTAELGRKKFQECRVFRLWVRQGMAMSTTFFVG